MSRIDGDLAVTGLLTATYFACPAGALQDAALAANAQVDATKLIHSHRQKHKQPNTTATTETVPLHVAQFAGEVKELGAASIVAAVGGATVTVDLKKNGTTVLSSILTLDNANTARTVETATLDPAEVDYVAGDFFELVITATAGGGTIPTGLIAYADFHEQSQ